MPQWQLLPAMCRKGSFTVICSQHLSASQCLSKSVGGSFSAGSARVSKPPERAGGDSAAAWLLDDTKSSVLLSAKGRASHPFPLLKCVGGKSHLLEEQEV